MRLAAPFGVVWRDDFLYVTDDAGVVKIDLLSNRVNPQTVLSSGGFLVTSIGIGLDTNGDLLVIDWGPGHPGISGLLIRVDPNTGAQQLVSSQGFMASPGGVVTSSAGKIYVVERSLSCEEAMGEPRGQILEIDGVTGEQTVLACNPGVTLNPWGIAVFPGDPVQVQSGSWGQLKSTYR